MRIPQQLTVVDGAMATDGGSVCLMGHDQPGNSIEIDLDWSIEAQRSGTAQLRLNKIPVGKRSVDEEKLLGVLKSAAIRHSQAQKRPASAPPERIVLGGDIKEYMDATDDGPEAALRSLIGRLVSNVMSEAYAKGKI